MPVSGTTAPCPECAAPSRTTGQSFCDSCGAFLRWETGSASAAPAPRGEADASESATAPLPVVPPEHAPGPGAADAADARRDADPAADPAAADSDATDPDAAAAPAAAGTWPAAAPAAAAGGGSEAARALLVPVPAAADPGPDPAERPGTVLPGRPEAGRPRVRTPQPAAGQQGPPCPACGRANAPARAFCRSCAAPLGTRSEEPAHGPFAGQRPVPRRERRQWIVRAVVVAAVVLVVVGGLIGGPAAARAVQDHFAKRVAVRPTAWIASHSAAGHGPEAAFDNYSNTWWGTGYAGDSNGQHLQADFAQPVDLLAVLLTPGTSKRPGQAADQARPQEVDLIVTDSAGRSRTVHRTLDDGGVQRVDVRGRDTVSVRLVLRSAYGSGPDRQVAVAEVEFFGRSRT
ncbi:discoidin domain-containing protein [Streptomyces antarcticus]|uniref:discoidin domain-containing protein n=2 Tax=Streptomyces antarcticus TaxID=2996458 RepID=UPI0022716A6F|nr:discoidin domain-containing protein [Streptomyces sp. H34-AA3]MCY0944354.1 discoidin domain-containing protein [Streptomyces sp. H34-AA3]